MHLRMNASWRSIMAGAQQSGPPSIVLATDAINSSRGLAIIGALA
jgi:hypothetical protein